MKPIDFIIAVIIFAVVGGAVYYVYREKKNGKKCIGCPYSNECGKKNCYCGTVELNRGDTK